MQGWEETTDAALTHLLRTSLAKPGKENQGATPITLDPPKDTVRLKKHISSVMDRVAKGIKISDAEKNFSERASSIMDFHEVAGTDPDQDPKVGQEEQQPIGSQFGEAGERLRSARGQRSRPGSSMSVLLRNSNGEIYVYEGIF